MYLWSAMRAPAHDLDAQPLLVDLERGSEPDIQSDCHDETSCETGYETVYAEKGYAEQAYAGYPLAEKATAHSSGSPPPRVSKRVRAYCILSFLAIAVTWCKPFYFPNVRQGITKPAHQESDICLTPACVHAASELLYNLSPQYKELDACTNFEELVCGGWRERHDLRPDQGDAFTGTIMAETSATLLRHILEAPYPKHSKHSTFSPARLLQSTSSTDEDNFNKLKTAYDACMDEETIKKEGTKPLKEMLTEISDMFTKSDTEFDTLSKDSSTLSETVLFLQKLGVSALVSTGAGADDTDPDTVVVQVSSPWRIGLPAKDYYKDKDVVAKYEAAFMAVLGALYPDSEVGKAEGLLEFEKRLAAASPDAEDQNDVTKYYNPLSLRDANKLAPSLHLSKIINGLAPKDFKTKRVIVMAPRYLKDLEKILEKTSRTTVQTYFLWKTIQAFASVTEADALKPYKRFLNTLSGRDADSVPERWRTCVNHVDSGLPWILSRFFVEKAFSEEAKRFGDEIVSDIKEQFIGKIGRTEWMEDGVKEKAIEKVRRIVQKIGYPTESPDIMDPGVLKDWYRAVHVGKGTFFDNYLSMTRLQVAQEWSSLGKPVDRAAWGMSVPTVNAYYNPPGNEIVFPAGIMQFPVFSSSLPSFISYGAFGSVAGHELSHAFDSTGRHYDMNGNYTDWWTPETVKGFEDRAECFVAQYGNYSVEGPDGKPLHVNGKLTLGENIADAGGVSASFAAWKSRVSRERSGCNERSGRELQHEDQSLPGLEHFTKEQLFFVSYSNWWCGKSRPEAAVQRIYTDPHAPKWARVLGTMANSREFKEAFGCGKGEEGKEPVCELW